MHLYIRTARYIIIHDLIYYVYRHDTLYSVYTYMHIHMQWIYSMWDNVSLCNMLELEIYLAVWGAEGGRKRDAARDERRHRRIHRETRRRKETDRGRPRYMARDAMNIDDGHKHNADFLADVATAEERSFRRNIKVGLRLEFREIEQRTKRAGRSGTWG